MTISTPLKISDFIRSDKPLWNAIAFLYTFSAYVGGIVLILQSSSWLNVLGVVSLTHGLVLSAYLAHEFMHGTIFDSKKWNSVGGNLVLWLNGGCYARFQDLAKMHIAHHVDRVDFCRFDLANYLQSLPRPIRWGLLALEWMYFPSLAFLSRIRSIFAPFWTSERKDERLRVIFILIIRVSLFTLLGLVSPKALLLYFLAYIGMISVLRVVDAFQHTYEVFPIGATLPNRDRTHEQENTFSNVISVRYWWLNLMLLNFGYHNAHHEAMKCPWHSLHELDRVLFTGKEPHYLTLPQLLHNYHRFRLKRITSGQGKAMNENGEHTLDTFYGGIEVSFLVLPA